MILVYHQKLDKLYCIGVMNYLKANANEQSKQQSERSEQSEWNEQSERCFFYI